MRFFDELMRDKKNSIDLHYIKTHFIGSSGIGKTTTKNRLIGLITNLASLPLEERKCCSTYLAESTQMLATMDTDKSKLTLMVCDDHDDETRMLFAYALSSKSTESTGHPPEGARGDQTAQTPPTTEPDVMESIAPPPEQADLNEGSKEVRVTILEVDKVVARLRTIVGSGNYAEQLKNKVLINLIDVGGQPGFLEMLPFLSKGPGMFLAFFRLDKDLDEPCEVSYEREQDKITPYKSIYTVRETLSQILSGIHHHVTFDSDFDQELLDKIGELASVEPVVTLVGTFKDKLEEKAKTAVLRKKVRNEFPQKSECAIKEATEHAVASSCDGHSDLPTANVDTELLSRVNQLLASQSFQKEVKDCTDQELAKKNKALSTVTCHFEDLLFHPADNQQFIALDNFTGTEADLDPLREHFQKMFDSFFKGAKLRIRPPQLLLGVALRKEYDIVSMDDCIYIERALSMGEEEVKFSVWYLDRWVGALIYHPEIEDKDDWFRKYIICSPQVVFDSISSLIVESLLEIDCPECSSRSLGLKPAEKKNWTEKGQFSLDTVKRFHSEESKKNVKKGKLIPWDKLVKFLEHSDLLSLITTKKQGRKEVMCFIPAILKCASQDELRKSPSSEASIPSPIKITFETGYVPIGVFCAMVSRLVSKGSTREGVLGMRWELMESGVKRNLVSFRVGTAKNEVTLIAHVHCYEIRVKPHCSDIHDLCSYTLSSVLLVMKEICKPLDHIIAFDCQCGQHGELEDNCSTGLCYLRGEEQSCVFFECDHGEVTLTKSQEYWFATVCCCLLLREILRFVVRSNSNNIGTVSSTKFIYSTITLLQETKHAANVCLKALPYVKGDPGVSFKWSRDGGSCNELRLQKVMTEHCTGYYSCEIIKNGEHLFSVHHCLRTTGELSWLYDYEVIRCVYTVNS